MAFNGDKTRAINDQLTVNGGKSLSTAFYGNGNLAEKGAHEKGAPSVLLHSCGK